MVNTEEFIKRLEHILEYYALTASAFADRINVQPSGISHLLTGRNKPSLEFVMKVVKTFPEVNLYWLLNGKGHFPPKNKTADVDNDMAKDLPDERKSTLKGNIQKIILFFEDGSFEVFDNSRTSPS